MSEAQWLVLRCLHCQQCSGQRGQKGRCPHCGQPFSRETEVVKVVSSAAELHLEVSLANTPESLREELRKRLERDLPKAHSTEDVTPTKIFRSLREAAGEPGMLTHAEVSTVLERLHVRESVDSVMGQAEVEGLAIRAGDGRWVVLE